MREYDAIESSNGGSAVSKRLVSRAERLCAGVGGRELHDVSTRAGMRSSPCVTNILTTRSAAGLALPRDYSEHSIGITWWPDKLITIRPELRYDHSYAEQSVRQRNQA